MQIGPEILSGYVSLDVKIFFLIKEMTVGQKIKQGFEQQFLGIGVPGETGKDKALGIASALALDFGNILSATQVGKVFGLGLSAIGAAGMTLENKMLSSQGLISKKQMIAQDSMLGLQIAGNMIGVGFAAYKYTDAYMKSNAEIREAQGALRDLAGTRQDTLQQHSPVFRNVVITRQGESLIASEITPRTRSILEQYQSYDLMRENPLIFSPMAMAKRGVDPTTNPLYKQLLETINVRYIADESAYEEYDESERLGKGLVRTGPFLSGTGFEGSVTTDLQRQFLEDPRSVEFSYGEEDTNRYFYDKRYDTEKGVYEEKIETQTTQMTEELYNTERTNLEKRLATAIKAKANIFTDVVTNAFDKPLLKYSFPTANLVLNLTNASIGAGMANNS